jgi:streptogramin lyase
VRKLSLLVAIIGAAAALAACGTSSGLLNKHQLRTPLQCPCPTIAPLATYTLPGEVPFGSNAYIGGVTSGADNNLWVTEFDAAKIARVTENGTVTEFPVPAAGAGPGIITSGPDGNLWFTDYNLASIWQITTAGVVTQFPLPPPFTTTPSNLEGIAAGPDGNIWFVDGDANVVGVMSTSGTLLKTYQIPTPNPYNPITFSGFATFIAAGPDGNMWFVEEAASKIGRIALPSGTITEFPTPTPNCVPKNLVVGADGNMWFPERDCGQIARITTSGVITEFQVTIAPSSVLLRRITSTPDGNLWFIQAAHSAPWTQNEVGEMNTSGVGTNLWAFPNGLPQGLATGADGSPWFTDEGNDTVVRL